MGSRPKGVADAYRWLVFYAFSSPHGSRAAEGPAAKGFNQSISCPSGVSFPPRCTETAPKIEAFSVPPLRTRWEVQTVGFATLSANYCI
jgi:hypothetical protein